MKIKLGELLAKDNMSASDLSKILNINKNALSSYINNKATMVRIDHIEKICIYFKCGINDLFELDNKDIISDEFTVDEIKVINRFLQSIKIIQK